MVAAKKVEHIPQANQHAARLESLLLNLNYKKNNSSNKHKHTTQGLYSRIEAEYQMERMFMNLF